MIDSIINASPQDAPPGLGTANLREYGMLLKSVQMGTPSYHRTSSRTVYISRQRDSAWPVQQTKPKNGAVIGDDDARVSFMRAHTFPHR